ncbi:MAG TPA: hypothetical protein ENN58_01880 [bacterium]|nr:hypothetical protein [bacterium]
MSENKLSSIFTLKQAKGLGFSIKQIKSGVSDGTFLRVGHGLYINSDSDIPAEDIDFFVACKKFGEDSFIGGLSALFYYGLIDSPPQQIWVVVEHTKRTVEKKYKLIRTRKKYEWGIIQKEYFRICNVNRAVVDAFRYSSKIGLRTAFAVAVRAISDNMTTVSEILKIAEKLECEKMMKKQIDTVIGMLEA